MKPIACPMLACVLLLSACSKDATPSTTPAPNVTSTSTNKVVQPPPVEPQKPATTAPAKPVEPPKPVVEAPKPPVEPAKPPADAPKLNADMDIAITELMAKPEVPDANIEIQHILVSFKGAPRMPATVTRSKEEAEVLAKRLWTELVGGANFDALVKEHTNDSYPGIYPMTKGERHLMVKGFGDVGFRLKVGEMGVAPWHATASPFGWHIIRRVK